MLNIYIFFLLSRISKLLTRLTCSKLQFKTKWDLCIKQPSYWGTATIWRAWVFTLGSCFLLVFENLLVRWFAHVDCVWIKFEFVIRSWWPCELEILYCVDSFCRVEVCWAGKIRFILRGIGTLFVGIINWYCELCVWGGPYNLAILVSKSYVDRFDASTTLNTVLAWIHGRVAWSHRLKQFSSFKPSSSVIIRWRLVRIGTTHLLLVLGLIHRYHFRRETSNIVRVDSCLIPWKFLPLDSINDWLNIIPKHCASAHICVVWNEDVRPNNIKSAIKGSRVAVCRDCSTILFSIIIYELTRIYLENFHIVHIDCASITRISNVSYKDWGFDRVINVILQLLCVFRSLSLLEEYGSTDFSYWILNHRRLHVEYLAVVAHYGSTTIWDLLDLSRPINPQSFCFEADRVKVERIGRFEICYLSIFKAQGEIWVLDIYVSSLVGIISGQLRVWYFEKLVEPSTVEGTSHAWSIIVFEIAKSKCCIGFYLSV